MDVNTQQMNNTSLYAAATVKQAPQSVQNPKGKGELTSPNSEVSTSLFPVTDQVRLSLEARQAYENSLSTQPVNPSEAASITENDETVSPIVEGDQSAVEGQSLVAESKSTALQAADESAVEEPTLEGAEADKAHLSADEKQQIVELELRDQEVQVHEAAHAAVGGQYAGAPSLDYETGPDGKRYAVSGEVNIDMSKISGDPAATMQKADVIRAAALAPAQPSSQDRNVAARAAQMKAEAQAELMSESAEAGNEMVESSVGLGALPPAVDDAVSDVAAPRFSGAVA